MKKVILLAVIAFLIFYAVTQPASSANIVEAAWHSLVNIAHGIGTFVQRMSGTSSSA